MAGFENQAAQGGVKMVLYGPAGSGKTFQLLAHRRRLGPPHRQTDRLPRHRIRHGLFGQAVPQRTVHPEAFDFRVLHTRSRSPRPWSP